MSQVSAAPAFVGREAPLAEVIAAIEGGPALVLIEGEAGIGKTRLLQEVLRSEPIAGRTVLLAVSPPLREPFPLGPVVDGVRRLRDRLGGVEDVGLSALGGALRPLFPEWSDGLPPALEGLDDPRETRHRLLRALTELVDRLGVEVLVVEDAHWVDLVTLEWLVSLTSSAGPAISIVVSYRPTGVPEDSLLRGVTSRVPPGMTRLRVELEPLDVAATRSLVASMVGAEQVSERFAAFLHDHADGIPLAIEESVRMLRDRQDIVRQDGQWVRRVLEKLDVPPTVRDSVLERVARLAPEARQVLEAAAVLAGPADEALLGAVAELDPAAGDLGVASALVSGLLRETSPGRYGFRHALDAQAVGDAIAASRRRRLHGRAAAALRSTRPEPVVRLARHYREAGDVDAWCHYGEAAADLAWDSGDGYTALRLLLDLLAADRHPVGERSRLVKKLGEAAVAGSEPLGELGARVRQALAQALAEAVADGEWAPADRGETRLLLARLLWQLGEIRTAYAETEAAIHDLASRPVLAGRAMMMLAIPYAPQWPVERHLDWLDRAMALVDPLDLGPDRLYFTAMRATVLLALGEPAGWRAAAEIPLSTSTESTVKELVTVANSLLNVAQSAIMWGRDDEARRRLAALEELVRQTGFRRLSGGLGVAEAQLRWYCGAWDGLAEVLGELLEAEETRPMELVEARLLRGVLDVVSGDARHSEARGRHLREVMQDLTRHGLVEPEAAMAAAVLGRIHLAAGRIAEAVEATEPIMGWIADKRLWHWAADIAPVHLDALIATGGLDLAGQLVERFAAGLDGRDAPAPAAALVVCRGIVAAARGEHERAAGLFADAALAWAALPRRYDELLAVERQGMSLLASGDLRRGPDGGVEVLTEVERGLRELGARWDAGRVARVLGEHGVQVVRAWRRGPKGYGDELSPRELEVVELVARGMTNKQAAESLFVSPKTVAMHLRSAMRKLGVSSRTAAAMAAAEAGLLPGYADGSPLRF